MVPLKKLTFAMSIIALILSIVSRESNIEFAMDRFSEAIPWNSGWEYRQVSWLSLHTNEIIRRETFSIV